VNTILGYLSLPTGTSPPLTPELPVSFSGTVGTLWCFLVVLSTAITLLLWAFLQCNFYHIWTAYQLESIPFKWKIFSAPEAWEYCSNRVAHNLCRPNNIDTAPSLIGCNQLWLPQLVDCLCWRVFVVPIKRIISIIVVNLLFKFSTLHGHIPIGHILQVKYSL
jgi:hypothetical protein